MAIDDFGTGYSSLWYLSTYPFYELKIDKSLILNIANSTRDVLIVDATISMAKSLNLRVVAEGIETLESLDILKQHNCEIAQGYYFAKPMPYNEYFEWLTNQKSTSSNQVEIPKQSATQTYKRE